MKKTLITMLSIGLLSIGISTSTQAKAFISAPSAYVTCNFSNGDHWTITTNSPSTWRTRISQCVKEGGRVTTGPAQ